MVIFGRRLFGKVDRVPNLGFVATKFFHIDYVPLIPTEAWLVFKQSGRTWRGIRIPTSFKSLLLAWLRPVALVAGVGGVIGAIVEWTGKMQPDKAAVATDAVIAAIGFALFAFLMFHKSVTRASYARALELAKLAKLSDAGLLRLAEAYGQPPVSFGFTPQRVGAPSAKVAAGALPVEMGSADDGGTEEPVDPQTSAALPTVEPLAPPMPATPPLRATTPLRGY